MSTEKQLGSGSEGTQSVMLQEVGRDAQGNIAAIKRADNALLAKLGYRSEFNRELSVCGRCLLGSELHTNVYGLVACLAHPVDDVRVLRYGHARLGLGGDVFPPCRRCVENSAFGIGRPTLSCADTAT